MLIPLYDDNPFRRITYAYVNWALIAANVLVFAVFQSGFVYDAKLAERGVDLLRHDPGGVLRAPWTCRPTISPSRTG